MAARVAGSGVLSRDTVMRTRLARTLASTPRGTMGGGASSGAALPGQWRRLSPSTTVALTGPHFDAPFLIECPKFFILFVSRSRPNDPAGSSATVAMHSSVRARARGMAIAFAGGDGACGSFVLGAQ